MFENWFLEGWPATERWYYAIKRKERIDFTEMFMVIELETPPG